MSRGRIRGIGIDAVAIDRMDITRMGMHVVSRMFNEAEVAEVTTLPPARKAEFLASRFAAKEAFVKALGTGFRGVSPRDIAVVVDDSGKPSLRIEEEPYERLHLEKIAINLSVTHEGNLAIAFVVLEDIDGTS